MICRQTIFRFMSMLIISRRGSVSFPVVLWRKLHFLLQSYSGLKWRGGSSVSRLHGDQLLLCRPSAHWYDMKSGLLKFWHILRYHMKYKSCWPQCFQYLKFAKREALRFLISINILHARLTSMKQEHWTDALSFMLTHGNLKVKNGTTNTNGYHDIHKESIE